MKFVNKFRHRLLLVYGLLLLMVLGGTLLFVYNVVLGEFKDYVNRKWNDRQARVVSWISSAYAQQSDWTQIAALIHPVLRYPIRWVRVTDTAGRVLLSLRAMPPRPRRGPQQGQHRMLRRRPPGMDMADCMGPMPRPVPGQEEINSFPLTVNGARLGRVDFLTVTFSHRIFVIDRIFSGNLSIIFLTAGGFSLFIFVVAGLILARSISRPLEKTASAVRRVKNGDLSRSLEVTGPEEIALLADSFNRMVDDLREKDLLQKQMSSDIAHELRTPLTILKTHLEGIRDGILSADRETVNSLLEETGRLERIIHDLRSIWDLEQGMHSFVSRIDVAALLQETVDKMAPLAALHNVTVSLVREDKPAVMSGDPEALHRTFLNLINNGVKYAGENGTVEVTVLCCDPLTVTVSDSGPGLPEEEFERVFERFYRVDASRNRRTGGAGLGLAIAKEAVRSLHGTITAGNDPRLGGACFTVQFPAGAAESRSPE